jgi:hypothetical protein
MASIHKKRNGQYSVRWRAFDGRNRQRTVPTRQVAKQLQKEVEKSIARGEDWQPRDLRPEPDVREVLKGYLAESVRVHTEGTALGNARALQSFVDWLEAREGRRGKLYPDILTRQLLAHYYDSLAKGGLHGKQRSATTKKKLVQAVERAWAWAYDDEDYGKKWMPALQPVWTRLADIPPVIGLPTSSYISLLLSCDSPA